MPLSRLYAIVSTSPRRTETLCPTACDTSVSAADRAAGAARRRAPIRRRARSRQSEAESGRRRRRAAAGALDAGHRWWIRAGRWRSSTDSACGARPWTLLGYHSKGFPRDALREPATPPISARTMSRPDERVSRRSRAGGGHARRIGGRRSPTDDAAVEDAAQGGNARAAGPRRSARRAGREAPRRARRRSCAAGPARRSDPRGALDHRVGRAQAAAPVRRQADARDRPRADPQAARPVGARTATSTPRASTRSSNGAIASSPSRRRSIVFRRNFRASIVRASGRSSRRRATSASAARPRTRFASSSAN